MLTAAMSAIDIALHDLVAKSLGVPVYQLLGGKQRDFVPCFLTTRSNDVDDLIAEVKGYVAEGWECIRTSMYGPGITDGSNRFEPRASIAVTAEWHTALREAVGPGPVLGPGLPPPPERGRGGVLLPAHAAWNHRLPGRADPRRESRVRTPRCAA